jgi:hypothetical protein
MCMLSAEDQARIRKRGDIPHCSGPNTVGQPITIAGRIVQLPPDAYVEGTTVNSRCPGEQRTDCAEAYLVIKRGWSQVLVGSKSGRITGRNEGSGEEGVFDFLDEALRSSDRVGPG